ncbi:AP2-like ethylene-responsive transcription factor AIL6 [Hirschfeldia incana]|nr:AP2-like ethylene-responsive transcription factor AIL6 [Hirschfeldia incana]
MAPMTNWLTFSLSPMDMLRSSDQSQFVSYDASSAASSSPYLLDNFYGWTNQKPQEFFKDEAQIAASMADSTILTTFVDPQTHSHNHIPKLEDFLGDVRYSDNSQTETQDSSSLTHIYDPRHHNQNQTGFYSDHNNEFKTMAGYQTAFSTNSGSEVEDSASIGRTHLAGEYLGHVVESSGGPELGFHGGANTGGVLSLGVNVNNNTNHRTSDDHTQINQHHYRGNNNGERTSNNSREEKTVSEKEKPVVAVETSDCSNKKIADTFGQRTSIYRGVTRHRWTGRYEAHLWDNSCRREGQARKGRQVYLGGYDKEDKAARAYDLAALKYWNATATTNFPITNYSKELEEMKHMTKQEFIASLRRKSSGFSRGASIYRGVTRHHQQGRWQARIGRVAGNKDLYLGTFATEEEAAEAYDIAAIKFRGINAVTNFEMNRYDVEAIMKSALPIGGAAKRLKLSLEAAASAEQKPILGQHHQLHHFQQQQQQQQLQLQSSPNNSSINFALCPNSAVQSQMIPCGIPFEAAALYHHQQQQQQQNFFQHFPVNAASDSTGSNNNSNVQGSMGLMAPNQAEFFLWPNQSY